ncbi:tetratricopeptide repeat-containing sulfotransferase family protein [Sandarakinorhabdus glacialis]|nr:sulfotransferase [Polymorphobacter glacialis]
MQPSGLPTNPDFSSQVDAALAAGDVANAVRLSRQAVAAGERDPFLHNLMAWQMVEDGDPRGAELSLVQALAHSPGDPHLLTTLGLALRRQHRLSEALEVFDTAIAVAPGYAVAWLERGFALHQGSSLNMAANSYHRAIALDPGRSQALAGVAAIAAAQGEYASARVFAGRALAIDPGDAVARCAVARCDIAEGAAAGAVAQLRELLAEPALNAENHSAAASLLGDGLARIGETAAAVVAYADAKSKLAAQFPYLVALEGHRQLADRLDQHIVAAGPGPWPVVAAGETRRHAFLLGYQRSGTTLVETILAGIEGVAALEELPTLAASQAAFLKDADGLQRLDSADAATLEPFRRAYWQRVADFGVGANAKLFLDMDPLKTLDLPLIARLFPAAPIIVMRRDPRDVVLSCFSQNFAASPVALAFTSLKDCARHYDAVMRLQASCLARLPNPVLEIRYEELVNDFDAVTRQLCDFLGLPWSEALRDFSTAARGLDVNTASVGQVRKGLFDGGGQWRQFEAEMAPILPILAPWTEKFDYKS